MPTYNTCKHVIHYCINYVIITHLPKIKAVFPIAYFTFILTI